MSGYQQFPRWIIFSKYPSVILIAGNAVCHGGSVSKEEYFAAIDQMAEAALVDATTQTNPRVPTKEEIVAIYEDLWDFE